MRAAVHGGVAVPSILSLLIGGYLDQRQLSAQHSQSLQAIFAHIPGLNVVMPASPCDAKGLLLGAIAGTTPTLLLEHAGSMTESALAKELGVDYLVIKHCSDDERSSLGVDYEKYRALKPLLKRAEASSDDSFRVSIKWSKILSGGKRVDSRCYGSPLIMQGCSTAASVIRMPVMGEPGEV